MNVRRLFCVVGLAFLSQAAQAVAVGDAAPALTLPDESGRIVDNDKLKGKLVYVDFWASWCGPCKRSFPWMNEMIRKYAPAGLVIVGVNVDKKRDDAQRFLKSTPAEFTVVYDAEGRTPAAWQVKAMPSSFLVDASGRVVLVESGFKDERKHELEQKIRAALPKP
ncbi:MAG TPA: TlpA disulfide reductase family protein [Casimicrobiaceae bacterium]|nr:TlpA disulfide reductase family protein [Casimicrobiaceae bacterium]